MRQGTLELRKDFPNELMRYEIRLIPLPVCEFLAVPLRREGQLYRWPRQ